ncbi:MAG TPA: hypothetical protein VMR62_05785, partial [Bryobacteraceae bacterium]|nr:hypothetical protein [Bryobacteraceae bacterium]
GLNIDREHPEYVAKKVMWKKYRDLYAGGEQIREQAFEYLVRRHKEPNDIYAERLTRVFYENYIGSIIDWYAATLMRREGALVLDGPDEAAKDFYNLFADDCDLKGTSLAEFFRQRFVHTLVHGRSYIVVDFPRTSVSASNRAEEDALGRSRAYLVDYSPEEVINWSYDDHGGLEWAVIRTSSLRKSAVTENEWTRETRWIHYDRQRYQVYQQLKDKEIRLIDEGLHGLAGLNRTPIFPMRVSEGLWLMNKAALLQLEHFNKSNALSWALTMGLFASPVIYSDREWNQIVGESYFIQLAPGDRFGWAEPEGKVYQIAADNLVQLKDEIYRVCYLIAHAAGADSSSQRQSGASKQRDFSITQEVLRAYGDAVKETMRQVLRAIGAARQDNISIDVSGLDEFDIADFSNELDDAQKLLSLGIHSETLKKQVFKKLAFKFLADVRQEIKTQIAQEIDAQS